MPSAPAPTPDHAKVREVFLAACDLAPIERAAFLADTCTDDTALRREVESLLAHDDATGDLLSEGRVGAANPFHLGAEVDPPTPAGIVQRNFGEFDKARPQFVRSLAIRRRVFPAGSEEIADSRHNLALLLSMSGKPLEAIPLMREALHIQRKALSPDRPDVARSLFNLSRTTLRAGQMADALALTNESLTLHRRTAPDNHEAIGMHLIQLASIESARSDHTAAERYALESIAILREHLPPNAPSLATALNELARVRLAGGDAQGAVEPSREAAEIASAVFASNPDHPLAKAVASTRASVQRALESRAPDPATSPSK